MTDYVAWLNGFSVARGSLAHVEAKAREVFKSPSFQEWETLMPNKNITIDGPTTDNAEVLIDRLVCALRNLTEAANDRLVGLGEADSHMVNLLIEARRVLAIAERQS